MASEAQKRAQAKYTTCAKGRQALRRARIRYAGTLKGRAARRRYATSSKGREATARSRETTAILKRPVRYRGVQRGLIITN